MKRNTTLNIVIHRHEYGSSIYPRTDRKTDEDFDIDQFIVENEIDFEEDKEELTLETFDLPKKQLLKVGAINSFGFIKGVGVYLDGNLLLTADEYQPVHRRGIEYAVDRLASSLSNAYDTEIVNFTVDVESNPDWHWALISESLEAAGVFDGPVTFDHLKIDAPESTNEPTL